jgi:single-strand DNA-binding protein
VNSVSLIGALTEPPELRTRDDGEEVCELRLAVPRFARGGTREPGVVYVVVTTGGLSARDVSESIVVGGRVGATGRLETQEWVGPDGERRFRWEVMADQLELLDPPPHEHPEASEPAA